VLRLAACVLSAQHAGRGKRDDRASHHSKHRTTSSVAASTTCSCLCKSMMSSNTSGPQPEELYRSHSCSTLAAVVPGVAYLCCLRRCQTAAWLWLLLLCFPAMVGFVHADIKAAWTSVLKLTVRRLSCNVNSSGWSAVGMGAAAVHHWADFTSIG